jgi:hypothetical protein
MSRHLAMQHVDCFFRWNRLLRCSRRQGFGRRVIEIEAEAESCWECDLRQEFFYIRFTENTIFFGKYLPAETVIFLPNRLFLKLELKQQLNDLDDWVQRCDHCGS